MFLYFTRPYADWFALVLFVSAAVTDWFDGYLARAWKQETKLGAMLDPIADKAMVVIALMVIIGFSSWSPWLVLPATVILFREVFVSGLREFLGDVAGTLKVTKLAKWKTTLQMIAIAVLFSQGVFEHYLGMSVFGMDEEMIEAILNGEVEELGLAWKLLGWNGPGAWAVAVVGRGGADGGHGLGLFAQSDAASEGGTLMDVLYFAWVRERIGLPRERSKPRHDGGGTGR